jgi:hypothetical protein
MLTAAITSTPTRRVGFFGLLIPLAPPPIARRGPHIPGRYHRGVIPPLLVLAGVVALAAGWLVMRRFGGRARIGRVLAVTPVVPVAEARAIAERGGQRYVGVLGRIDSEHEFEDEHQRPLVLRRTRLETRAGSRWTAIEDVRQVVPFEISETLATIAVDGDALDEGLVVVSREAEGTAADVPDRVPEGTPPATPVRLRIEQVSSVEHALVLGLPVMDPDRGPILRPGFGRPLILTTLERDEAMRVLASGRRETAILASALLAGGLVAALIGTAWWVIDALV